MGSASLPCLTLCLGSTIMLPMDVYKKTSKRRRVCEDNRQAFRGMCPELYPVSSFVPAASSCAHAHIHTSALTILMMHSDRLCFASLIVQISGYVWLECKLVGFVFLGYPRAGLSFLSAAYKNLHWPPFNSCCEPLMHPIS